MKNMNKYDFFSDDSNMKYNKFIVRYLKRKVDKVIVPVCVCMPVYTCALIKILFYFFNDVLTLSFLFFNEFWSAVV